MPSEVIERLSRILPLADKVADDIVCEETQILDTIIPRMYEVMQTAVKFACEYVKRGRFGRQSSFPHLRSANDRRENGIWGHQFECQGYD